MEAQFVETGTNLKPVDKFVHDGGSTGYGIRVKRTGNVLTCKSCPCCLVGVGHTQSFAPDRTSTQGRVSCQATASYGVLERGGAGGTENANDDVANE